MKLSMSNIAWLPGNRLRAYSEMASHGVFGLEIAPALFFCSADDPFIPDLNLAKIAISEIVAEGISIVSMQSLLFGINGAELFGKSDARERFEHGITRAINLAGRFGIPNLVFGAPTQRNVPAHMNMADAFLEAVDVFRKLGDKAQSAGVTIAIEPNPKAYGTNFLNTIDEVWDFTKLVNHPAICLMFDTGSMHINKEYENYTDYISKMMPWLNHVHISEPYLAPVQQDGKRLALFLKTLDEGFYEKFVSVEMKTPINGLDGVTFALDNLSNAVTLGYKS